MLALAGAAGGGVLGAAGAGGALGAARAAGDAALGCAGAAATSARVSCVGAAGFSAGVTGAGNGSSFTSGRAGVTGAGAGAGAAIGSVGIGVEVGSSHQTSKAASSTAFTESPKMMRPDAWLHSDRARGAGERSRCTTGMCRSRCCAAFVSASRMYDTAMVAPW